MAGRIIAIGDIHGCTAALKAVLAACRPYALDTVVTLGDYIDRGPDTRGTIDELLVLASQCQLIPLLGNHDEMLLSILSGNHYMLGDWLGFGGDATLASYGCLGPDEIPPEHIDFLRQCRGWHETERHIFIHATYNPRLPLTKQPPDVLRWNSLRESIPGPHRSGKVAIVGHTAQKNGEILDLGHLKCIDTYVYGDGWLTALDVHSGQVWQADKAGNLRQ